MKSKLILIISLLFIYCCTDKSENKKDGNEDYSDQIPVIDEVWLADKIEKRNGKILFINFWATWCVPCVEEFPDLVKIYNKYKNSDFEFLSVSVDLPSEAGSKVKPFLLKHSAEFPVVIAEEKKSERIINLINPDWNGAVPVTVIYNANGEQKEFIEEARDFDFFDECVKRLTNHNIISLNFLIYGLTII